MPTLPAVKPLRVQSKIDTNNQKKKRVKRTKSRPATAHPESGEILDIKANNG